MLTLQVKEKEIENLTPEEEFIRGTVGAECQIDLDEFWQGYENTVVFKRENDCTIYNVAIDSLSNRVEIPYTILAESGSFKVGLFGVKPDEVLPTLWSDYIKVRYGTDTHGTTPPKYEPNEIDQLRLSKQDKLTAGDGITIDENNVISAVDEKTVVDQTYNQNSQNAQSGKAVAEAVIYKAPRIPLTYKAPFGHLVGIIPDPTMQNIGGKQYPADTEYIYFQVDGSKGNPVNVPGFIAKRDTSTGNLWTGIPVDDVDCANKKYVDDKTVVDQEFSAQSENAQSGIAIGNVLADLDNRVTNLHGLAVRTDMNLTDNYYTKTEVDEALQNVSIDATTTPTADKIPKYNQYGQLIVNCTEYEPGTETAKVYSGESVPRDLWKAYINNFHQKITNLDNRTTGIDSLFDKKISFQYATTDTEVTLKSNCIYLVIDHSGSNNTNVYITKSDNTKVVATTQGDSAVENFPAFRLSLIFVPHDYQHTIVIGQTGKLSLTNLSPLYTKQIIWSDSNKNMFIKTTGTSMSIWEVNI